MLLEVAAVVVEAAAAAAEWFGYRSMDLVTL